MLNNDAEKIKNKPKPSMNEKIEYIKYLSEKSRLDSEINELKEKWGKTLVEQIVEDVKSRQKKATPKKYYVSLKEPLEGFGR